MTRLPALAAAALLVSALVGAAHAATLGTVTSSTMQVASFTTGAFLDEFTAPAGGSLAARTDTCGDRWAVTGGAFTTTGSGAVVASGTAKVTATVPLCGHQPSADALVGANMRNTGPGTFGLLMHAAADGSPAVALTYSTADGTVRLTRFDGTGASTELAAASRQPTSSGNRYLTLAYAGGTYTARVNGSVVLTATVAGTVRTTLEQNRQVGLVAVADSKTTFANFHGYAR